MTFRTSIYALASLSFAAMPALAEDIHTGFMNISIADRVGDRPIDGYLWYPTSQNQGIVQEHGNAVWKSIDVVPNGAPVAGKHPLVLVSHGMYGNSRNQAWLAQGLIEKGYIVAAIDHPGTSTFQRDPDQARALWERPHDITRTIDHILQMEDMNDLIDQDRIFMAGHSLGGFTAVALAGGRYDVAKVDGFCAEHPDDLVCGIFDRWQVAKTPQDRETIAKDWSDPRIKGFAVFDLGGTQTFSAQSLGAVTRPMLVYGAPLDISGLDLDVESRALVAALPKENVTYLEPETLSHFDFLGVCTDRALAILREEEPEDVYVCERGTEERAREHGEIIATVAGFFTGI